MAPKGKEKVEEALEKSVEFEILLDDLEKSYKKMTREFNEELEKRLTKEAPHSNKGKSYFTKVNQKLYTAQGGTFIVKIKPTKDSPPSDHLSLLFRWSDLYFEAFHAHGKWFRLKDAWELLPPSSQLHYSKKEGEGVFTFPRISSSYNDIGGYDIQVGPMAFQRCYKVLMNADQFVREKRYGKFSSCGVLSLPVVAISEALRFLLFQEWVVTSLSSKKLGEVEEYVPEEHSQHFNSWEVHSRIMFKPNPPADIAKMMGVLKRDSDIPVPVKGKHDHEASSSKDEN